jgi:hypothetical protein
LVKNYKKRLLPSGSVRPINTGFQAQMASEIITLKTAAQIKVNTLEEEAKLKIQKIMEEAEAQKAEIQRVLKLDKKKVLDECKEQIDLLKKAEKAAQKVAKMKAKMELAIKDAENELAGFTQLTIETDSSAESSSSTSVLTDLD